MVAVVAASGLGLLESSLNIAGAAGGGTQLGQAGGSAYVNAASGNLILQFLDEQMSGTGADMRQLRTYNSKGSVTDGDLDGWRWAGERKVTLSGTRNASGSTVTRTTGDGHAAVYSWNGSSYVSKEGAGAHDSIVWNSSASEWVWTEGSSKVVERYNGSNGWIKNVRDPSGNGFNFTFSGNTLTKVADVGSGQTMNLVYSSSHGKLARLDTSTTSTGALTRQVYYYYDSSQRLSKVSVDLTPSGNSISDGNVYSTNYTYDGSSNRVKSISQSDGTAVSFTYDSSARVRTVVDQSGTTTFTYYSGRTDVKNGAGKTWNYYHSSGRLTKVVAPSVSSASETTTYTYDSSGNVKTVSNNAGTIEYWYDSNGNRTKEEDSVGNVVDRTFSNNRIITEKNAVGTAHFVYDSAGRLRYSVSAEGRVSESRYDSRGLLTYSIQYSDAKYTSSTFTESALNTWRNSRNDTVSQQTKMEYDFKGNLARKTAFGDVNSAGTGVANTKRTITDYVYSEHGQLLKAIAVYSGNTKTVSSIVYDGMGRQTSVVGASGTTTTSYQSLKTVISNSASGLTVTSAYDSAGRLTSVSKSGSGANRISNYYYDSAGRVRMTRDASGAYSYVFYDAAGRISNTVSATGSVTGNTYNSDGRVTKTTHYANKVSTSGWSSAQPGSVSVSTSGNDRSTSYAYDAAGRLTTETVSSLSSVVTTYDSASRVSKVTQGSRVTRYYYDKDGLLLGSLNADGRLVENTYDAVGRLTSSIRYEKKVADVNAAFSSLRTSANSGSKLYSYLYYDAQGRQVGGVNEQGFFTETIYDPLSKTQQSKTYMSAVSASTSSSLSSLRSAGGSSRTTTVYFDDYGRTYRVKGHDGSETRNYYDSAGRLNRVIQAYGTSDSRGSRTEYNAFGEVTGMVGGVGDAAYGTTTANTKTAIDNYGTRFTIDGSGRKIAQTGATGEKTYYYYDAEGRLEYTVGHGGQVSKTLYNSFGQAKTITVYSGVISTASLTGGTANSTLTNRISAIGSSADSVTYTFTQSGQVKTVKDDESFDTTNTYNSYGELTDVYRDIKADGSVRTRTHYTYDILGRSTNTYLDYASSSSYGARTSAWYDGFGRVIQTRDANDKITGSVYLDSGRSIEITDPLSRKAKTTYDALGRVLYQYDGYSKRTTYSYDDGNRAVTVTTPEGVSVTTWRSRTGETVRVNDGRNGNIYYTYTKDGKLDTVKDAKGVVITDNTYNKDGRIKSTKDGNGAITEYAYDFASRTMTRTVDAGSGKLNLKTRYVFDGQGRELNVVEAYGSSDATTTRYVYNGNGQIRQIIKNYGGLNLSTRFSYDGQGNVTKTERGDTGSVAQQVSTYEYDKLGRKIKEVVDPGTGKLNITTQYKYDKAGNLTRIIDANNNSTWFVYNSAGEQSYQVNARGEVTRFEYNKNGQLYHTQQYWNRISTSGLGNIVTSVSVSANSANDRRTYTAYDDDGRARFVITAVKSNMWSVTESVYDGNGNVTELRQYGRTLNDTHINSIRTSGITDTEVIGKLGSSLSGARRTYYVYDANNRQTITKLPGYYDKADGKVHENNASDRFQRTIEVKYDAMGNAVTNIIRVGPGSSDFIYQHKTYDKAGRLKHDIDGLGYVTEYEYSALGQIKQEKRWSSSVGVQLGAWSATSSALTSPGSARTITHTYDGAGRKKTTVLPSVTNNFKSNATASSNGTSASLYSGSPKTEYFYDDLGNLTLERVHINSTDRADTYHFYDKAGRETLTIDAERYATRMEYDGLGNQKKVTEYALKSTGTLNTTTAPSTPTNGLDRISTFGYDAAGRRTSVVQQSMKYSYLSGSTYYNTTANKTVASIEYNAFGDVSKQTDVAANATQMQYDRAGNVTKITEPSRKVGSSAMDPFRSQGNVRPTVTIAYDVFGSVLSETRASGGGAGQASIATNYSYDFAGNQMTVRDGENHTTSYKYDVSGKVIEQRTNIDVSSAQSALAYTDDLIRRFEYDKAGRQVATLDVYDGKVTGQLNKFNAFGEVYEERRVYGSSGITSAASLSSSIATRYVYDSAGRLNHKQGTDGYTRFFYDLRGNATRMEQRGNVDSQSGARVTEQYFDKLGRASDIRSPKFTGQVLSSGSDGVANSLKSTTYSSSQTTLNPKVHQVFDRWGNVLEKTDEAGVKTSYQYNHANKAVKESFAVMSVYDKNGNSYTAKRVKDFYYDAMGSLVRESTYVQSKSNPYGFSSTKNNYNYYNQVGQLVQTKDSTGIRKDYAYDAHGNKIAERNGLGYVNVYKFNGNNQMVERGVLRRETTSSSSQTISIPYGGTQTIISTSTVQNPYNSFGSTTANKFVATASYQYDQAGRKYADVDAFGNAHVVKYDARGLVTATRTPIGTAKTMTYDHFGNKKSESQKVGSIRVSVPTGNYDAYGQAITTMQTQSVFNRQDWTYSTGPYAISRIASHKALDGRTYDYDYSRFYQVSKMTDASNANNYMSYVYTGNGHVASMTDKLNGKTSSVKYLYDIRGALVYREDASSDRKTYTSTTTTTTSSNYGGTTTTTTTTSKTYDENLVAKAYYSYDRLGRLVATKSPRVAKTSRLVNSNGTLGSPVTTSSGASLESMTYRYDDLGNRSRVSASYRSTSGSTMTPKTETFVYDTEGRVLKEGDRTYTYNAAGQRATEYFYSKKWTERQQTSSTGSGPYGNSPTYANVTVGDIYTRNKFSYNDLGLRSKVELRSEYKRSSTGAWTNGNYSQKEAYTYNNAGMEIQRVAGSKKTTTRYRADGQMLELKGYTNSTLDYKLGSYSYDEAGNLKSYKYYNYKGTDYTNTYNYQYIATYRGYQQQTITASTTLSYTAPGYTKNTYDQRGRLTLATVSATKDGDRRKPTSVNGTDRHEFLYNADNQIVSKKSYDYATSKSTSARYFYYQGAELSSITGSTINITPLDTEYGGGGTPGGYTVNQGDTLAGIAQSVFGDASLWYVIADANGLRLGPTEAFGLGDDGRSLKIPNDQQNVKNTSSNFKPYNETEIIGDLTPEAKLLAPPPPPPAKKGCGVVAMIAIIVVAVVVTVFTAGAALAAMAPAAATAATSAATVTAAAAGSLSATMAIGGAALSGAAGLVGAAAAAVGGFVGSLASQAVGVATGMQESISMKQAFASGLTSAFSAGVGSYLRGVGAAGRLAGAGGYADDAGKLGATGKFIQGATSYAGGVAANKVSGLDASFSWKGMAAQAVGSVVGGSIGDNLGFSGAGPILGSALQGATTGAITAKLNKQWNGGGKLDYRQIAIDAFGNALAEGLVSYIQDAPVRAAKKAMGKDKEVLGNQFDRFVANGGDPRAYKKMLDNESMRAGLIEIAGAEHAGPSAPTGRQALIRGEYRDVVDGDPSFAEQVFGGSKKLVDGFQEISKDVPVEQMVSLAKAVILGPSAWLMDKGAEKVIGVLLEKYAGDKLQQGVDLATTALTAVAVNESFEDTQYLLDAAAKADAGVITIASDRALEAQAENVELGHNREVVKAGAGAFVTLVMLVVSIKEGMSLLKGRMAAAGVPNRNIIDDLNIEWGKGIGKQGFAYENYLASKLPASSRLPANFKTFDFFDDVSGLATSAKTLDTGTASRLAKPEQIYSTLKRNVDAAADFTNYTLKGRTVDASMIASREIKLGVPSATNKAQWEQLSRAVEYANTRNINLIIDQVK